MPPRAPSFRNRDHDRRIFANLSGLAAVLVLAGCGGSGTASTPRPAAALTTQSTVSPVKAAAKRSYGRAKSSSARKPQNSLYTGAPYGCPFEMADFVAGVAGQPFITQITPVAYDDANPDGPGTLTWSFIAPFVTGWTLWPTSWNAFIAPTQAPYPTPVTITGDIPLLTPNGDYVAILIKTPQAPDVANPQDCKPIVVTVAAPSPTPTPIIVVPSPTPVATAMPSPTPTPSPLAVGMIATLVDNDGVESEIPNSFEDPQVAAEAGPIIDDGSATSSRLRRPQTSSIAAGAAFPCDVHYNLFEKTGALRAVVHAKCSAASKAVFTFIQARFRSAGFNSQTARTITAAPSQTCGGAVCDVTFLLPISRNGLYAVLVNGTATTGKFTATSPTGGFASPTMT